MKKAMNYFLAVILVIVAIGLTAAISYSAGQPKQTTSQVSTDDGPIFLATFAYRLANGKIKEYSYQTYTSTPTAFRENGCIIIIDGSHVIETGIMVELLPVMTDIIIL